MANLLVPFELAIFFYIYFMEKLKGIVCDRYYAIYCSLAMLTLIHSLKAYYEGNKSCVIMIINEVMLIFSRTLKAVETVLITRGFSTHFPCNIYLAHLSFISFNSPQS